MTTMRECVDKLASEIGARPVGTDEEQQASFFIEQTFKNETNFDVEVQEFDATSNPEAGRAVGAVLVFLSCVLSMIASTLKIAWLVLCAAGSALFVLNELGIFSLSQFFGRAPSQNVVAVHKPLGSSENSRNKKIVVLTNYDSEKLRTEEASGLAQSLNKIKFFEVGACVIALLANLIVFIGGASILTTILFIIGLIGSALPIAIFAVHITAKYNDGANNNAASVAVMLDAAKRVSSGVYVPKGEATVIHGSSKARAAGAIPENVNVEWENENPISADSVVASMLFDKSRISGETEQPVAESFNNAQEVAQITQASYEEAQVDQVKFAEEGHIETPVETEQASASSAPDWFTRGLQKAGSKGNLNADKVRRSSYGDAITRAEQNTASVIQSEAQHNNLQEKLQAIHDQIEGSSSAAASNVQKDAEVASVVLRNELADDDVQSQMQAAQNKEALVQKNGVSGFLATETETSNFESSLEDLEFTCQENQKQEGDKDEIQAEEVPVLRPLEPEYGVEVDVNELLDKGRTEPLEAVETSATTENEMPDSTPEEVPLPKRDITLPSLTGAIESEQLNKRLKQKKMEEEQHQQQNSKAQNRLSVNLPSLTSEVPERDASPEENKAVSNVSVFGVGEATGTFAPITDEDLRLANDDDEDMYVYDADDTALQEATTDSGAVAGPGYVDIPETHVESIFGKLFHKKDKGGEDSLAESIGVDDSYEARSVGKHRGDWSSFEDDAWSDDDDWNGGAVVVGDDVTEQASTFNERDEIYNFAANDLDVEVWCVALGAEASNHSGVENFLQVNSSELKGARFITLDAMGAGELSIVEKEGVYKPQCVQTRMKRIVRDAAKSIGISVQSERMQWKQTTSSKLGAGGFKYVHLAGFEGGKPAFLSSPNDSSDAVEDETLRKNADYLMELIRTL